MSNEFTLGEICAGISGFGLGFERAGWSALWQFEINRVCREVLADNFPSACRHADVNHHAHARLAPVRCIAFGFPCQDLSVMGSAAHLPRAGLCGARSGLFFRCMEVVNRIKPAWVVIENVPALLSSNGGKDIQQVIVTLRECGYVGYGRVLDAQYFGVPQRRRRLFLVAGLGRLPPPDFMAPSAPMEAIPFKTCEEQGLRHENEWAAYTLTAPDHRSATSRFNLGGENIICERGRWDQNIERQRAFEADGLPLGLDVVGAAQAFAAGNAVVPQIAEWIARILKSA